MHFDSIILGTGQAGPPLANSLANNNERVAIIEKDQLGGTCVNTGCTPSKTYAAAARRAYIAKNSLSHGVEVGGKITINLKTIKDRKDQIVQSSRDGLQSMFDQNKNLSLIRGTGTFKDEHTIQVGDQIITGDKIYINVGMRAVVPNEFAKVNFLTNESILELEKIPEHLIIVGGGYIGLEFGQMFRRFGSKVTILNRSDRLLKKEDSEFSEAITDVLENEGIVIRNSVRCHKASTKNGKPFLVMEDESGKFEVSGSHLLLAAGRKPNTDQLDLDKAGVEVDQKGYIVVNDQLKSNISHIWALGDCNGHGGFTHTSYNDFQIVNTHLRGGHRRNLSDRHLCYATYIDPPFARVGMNASDIRQAGIKAKVASIQMDAISRAKEKGETRGVLKVYIESQTDKILGACFLGVGADEYIHTLIDQMYADQPYTVIRDAVHIHPTVSELLPTMLENLEEL